MKNWEEVFYSNISTYIGLINKTLSKKFNLVKLGQYIKLKGGYAFKSSEYKTKGIPVIRISDFQNEKIVLDNVKYYEEDDKLQRYELHESDIIIAMTGGTIGKLAIVQPGLGKLYLNQRVGKFEVINNKDFIKEYIYWIARGVESKIKELAWGGAQPNVSSKQIENMEFSLPDKETQKKIIEFLNDLKNNMILNKVYFDKKCETKILKLHKSSSNINILKSAISTQQTLLKKLRQSILQEAIEGKLTASWREHVAKRNSAGNRGQNPDVESASVLLEKIKHEKEQLILEKKIKKQKPLPPINEDEIPFEIPESWEWCRLGDIIIMNYGKSLTKSQTKSKDKYAVYGSNGIIGYCDKGLTEKRAIIIGRKGSAGAIQVSQKGSWTTDVAYYIEESSNIYFEYLINLLKSLKLDKLGKGIKPGLNRNEAYLLMVPLSLLEEQKEIVRKIENLFAICDELESQIEASKKSSQTLMQAVLKEAFKK